MSKFNYSRMYSTAVRLIGRFGGVATCTHIERTGYDPPTDTETQEPPVDFDVNFVQTQNLFREMWNTTVQIGDKVVFLDCQQSVEREDTLKFADDTIWRIKDLFLISPDDANKLVYTLLLRQ